MIQVIMGSASGESLAPIMMEKRTKAGVRSGAFVTLASGLPGDTDALPLRADARLVAATLQAGSA